MSTTVKAAKDTRKPVAILNMQIITHVKIPVFKGRDTIGQTIDTILEDTACRGEQVNEINLILDPVSVNNVWLDMNKDFD